MTSRRAAKIREKVLRNEKVLQVRYPVTDRTVHASPDSRLAMR